MAFLKKNLCGICVLCGDILFFSRGGHGDFYHFLNNNEDAADKNR
jgi:ribosomal protein S27E